MKALELLVKLDLKHAGDYKFVSEIIRKSNGELVEYGAHRPSPVKEQPKVIKYERPFI